MSEELRNKLLGLSESNLEASKTRQRPPGWSPGVVWDEGSGKGEIITEALYESPEDWSDILRERGLDPERYEIVNDTVRWTSWDGWRRDFSAEAGGGAGAAYSALCYAFKAEIRLKRRTGPDAEELLKEVRRVKKRKKVATGNATLVVPLADWQVGNRDGGGIESQIEAIGALPELILDRASDLKKLGYSIGHIVLAGMGDLMENCEGFYSYQAFAVELDRREQTRVVRRGVTEIFKQVAPRFERVTGIAVGGNHGENRNSKGKKLTGTNDNDDVAVFEQVAEILSANPEAFGNVEFRLPAARLAVSLDLHGVYVGFTHGHLARGDAAKAMWEWWKGQSHGRQYPGIADADVLVTGHFHHLNIKEQANRTLLICPSLTRVSDYYGDETGYSTVPGTLSFVVTEEGWDELKVLR